MNAHLDPFDILECVELSDLGLHSAEHRRSYRLNPEFRRCWDHYRGIYWSWYPSGTPLRSLELMAALNRHLETEQRLQDCCNNLGIAVPRL